MSHRSKRRAALAAKSLINKVFIIDDSLQSGGLEIAKFSIFRVKDIINEFLQITDK